MTPIELIKSFEGCRLKAYQDDKGVWTIGWGQTGPDIVEGLVWTQEEADQHLEHFVEPLTEVVKDLVKVPLNDNQLSVLVSFAYNEGSSALGSSHLLLKLNAWDYQSAAKEFPRWDKIKIKGVLVPNAGLLKRRIKEAALFLTP